MAITGSFKCNKCGNIFYAQIGGLMYAAELRCVDCDNREYVKVGIKEKTCERCGGKMTDKISTPMCPSCKSRDNKIEEKQLNLD